MATLSLRHRICDAACAAQSLVYTEDMFSARSHEIDTDAELQALISAQPAEAAGRK